MPKDKTPAANAWSPPLAGLAVFLVAAVLYTAGLGRMGLMEPDEARYAAVAQEMLADGDFITPRFNGFVYLDKPPLLHWLTALSFAVLGPTEFAARLFPALAGAATVALTYAFGRRGFGHRAGLLSAAVLGSMLLWFVVGRVLRFDTLLAFFVTASLWWAWQGTEGGAHSRRDYVLASIAAGLGVLVKGPVAAVLPLGIILIYLTAIRRLRVLRGVPWLSCAGAFAVIVVPWFALCEQANPGTVRFFLIHENVARAMGRTDATHLEPIWYFLPVIAVGAAPWTLLLPRAVALGWTGCRHGDDHQRRACALALVWFGTVVVLFSIPETKLAPYILPAAPALALLIGRYLPDPRRGRLEVVATGALMIVAAAALQMLGAEPTARAGVPPVPLVPLTAATLLIGGVAAVTLGLLRRAPVTALAISAAAIVIYQCLAWGVGLLARPPSDRAAVRAAATHRRPGERVVCYRKLSRGAVFYLNTRVAVIGMPPGEYEFPPNADKLPDWVYDLDDTKALVAESPPMIGLARVRDWDDLASRAPEHVEELEQVGKHVIFRTTPSTRGP